jgi:dTDP-glucose 4,6-dehydratase
VNILVSGGAGFIGSEFIFQALTSQVHKILVVDSLTYAGRKSNLVDFASEIDFFQADICNKKVMDEIFRENPIDYVVNFAAESHVDNSIANPDIFLETNVGGTLNLLKLSQKYNVKKFLQVSTDEVYGSIETGLAEEHFSFNPSSPYSASKAAAEHFVNAASKTHGLVTSIVRCSNNYGPRQNPEKLIPLAINNLLNERSVPVYGSGSNIREWIHVSDCAKGILTVLESGSANTTYNISSGNFKTNLEILSEILKVLNMPNDFLNFVEDRKGHDYRYAIDSSKIQNELGWKCMVNLDEGIANTIEWYKNVGPEWLST